MENPNMLPCVSYVASYRACDDARLLRGSGGPDLVHGDPQDEWVHRSAGGPLVFPRLERDPWLASNTVAVRVASKVQLFSVRKVVSGETIFLKAFIGSSK